MGSRVIKNKSKMVGMINGKIIDDDGDGKRKCGDQSQKETGAKKEVSE